MEYAARNRMIPSFWLEQLGGVTEMQNQWRSKCQGKFEGYILGWSKFGMWARYLSIVRQPFGNRDPERCLVRPKSSQIMRQLGRAPLAQIAKTSNLTLRPSCPPLEWNRWPVWCKARCTFVLNSITCHIVSTCRHAKYMPESGSHHFWGAGWVCSQGKPVENLWCHCYRVAAIDQNTLSIADDGGVLPSLQLIPNILVD